MKTGSNKKRRHHGFLKFLIVVLLIVGFWFFENYTFKINKVEIESRKVEKEITLAVLSDLHGSVFGVNNSSLIKGINQSEPDLVFMLGDMYSSTDTDDDAKMRVAELAENIYAPIYYVSGEHDNNAEYKSMLKKVGVNVLDDKSDSISVYDSRLTIYGIDNAYFPPDFSLERKFGEADADSYSILLAHIPNYDAYMQWGADLTLCGDTHGGVMQIPFCGPLYYEGKWLPELSSDAPVYDKGLFEENKSRLFVTSGLGNYPLPIRLFNRPELVIIKVKPR